MKRADLVKLAPGTELYYSRSPKWLYYDDGQRVALLDTKAYAEARYRHRPTYVEQDGGPFVHVRFLDTLRDTDEHYVRLIAVRGLWAEAKAAAKQVSTSRAMDEAAETQRRWEARETAQTVADRARAFGASSAWAASSQFDNPVVEISAGDLAALLDRVVAATEPSR